MMYPGSASTTTKSDELNLMHLSAPKAGATLCAPCPGSASTSPAQCPDAPTHDRCRQPSQCAHLGSQAQPNCRVDELASWGTLALECFALFEAGGKCQNSLHQAHPRHHPNQLESKMKTLANPLLRENLEDLPPL